MIAISSNAQGLRQSGKKIVDQNGNEVILRGMGLGGWMLQEPYMMEMSSFASAQWQIKQKIQDLIGPANTNTFYDAWLANHMTKRDIDSLASWGFNSVRLPMHYNLFTLPIEDEAIPGTQTWLTKGFALTDSLVKWCSANHIYVILDLHAAPGGQGKDYAICDGNPAKPSLWESDVNKQKTIALWVKLAQRYANEPWVGGYDLINEPNWSFTSGGNPNGCSENSNAPLRQLYINLTNAIRQVDSTHMIIIEGNCWGNNYNGMFPLWDANMALSFHKYWSTNDQGSIQGIINLRNQYNVPIWLGESGENSNAWFTDAISLAEKNKIGWAWWPLKKINSVVCPLTIRKTPEYQSLLDYWENGGTAPNAGFAAYTLMQMASNANISTNTYRKDLIDAMFRQVHDSTNMAFSNNIIPGVIHASDYDLGRMNKAWWDKDFADYHVSTGVYTTWNSGGTYRNDGVDIEKSLDTHTASNGYNVGWTSNNEWMTYLTRVDSAAAYNIQLRYAAPASGSKIILYADDADITGPIVIPATGGNQLWSNLMINDVILYKGLQSLKMKFEVGGLNFGFLNFTLSKKITDVALKALSAETYNETQLIYCTFNKKLVDTTIKPEGFSCFVNGNAVNISSLLPDPLNPFRVIITLSQLLTSGDVILLNYNNGAMTATDGTLLQDFLNLPVKNNLPILLSIPGKIEAEAFSFNQGLQLENTTDLGGGQNIAYTNAGDYLDYKVKVMKTATYKMEVRIACMSQSGMIQVQQISDSGIILHSVNVVIPVTGGWQSWQSIFTEIPLNVGPSVLRVKVIQPEFNMNWYKFTEKIIDTIPQKIKQIKVFPNPASDAITVETTGYLGSKKTIYFRTLNGMLAKEIKLSASKESEEVFIGDLAKGMYLIELELPGTTWKTKLTVQ
ncbi:MAG: carbohydrate-binding protein [Bacteroidota bacterium]